MSDSGSSGGATLSKDHLQQVFQNFGQHELNELKVNLNPKLFRLNIHEIILVYFLKALSYSINEMIDCLDAKVECFTMGVLSTLVANEINSTRKKVTHCLIKQLALNIFNKTFRLQNNPSNKVSLLLIDRNLDLSVTSLFQEETVFDKINNLLPNSCPYSNDIKIDLRTFLFENKFKRLIQFLFQLENFIYSNRKFNYLACVTEVFSTSPKTLVDRLLSCFFRQSLKYVFLISSRH